MGQMKKEGDIVVASDSQSKLWRDLNLIWVECSPAVNDWQIR